MTARSRLALPALALLSAAVSVVLLAWTSGGEAALPGLPATAAAVRWGLPGLRAVHDLAAALTVGSLVLAAVVVPGDPTAGNVLLGVRARLVRVAAGAGAAWVLAGCGVIVLTYLQLAGGGQPLGDMVGQLNLFVTDFALGRGLGGSTAIALVVTLGCLSATRVSTTAWLAIGALGALVPLALVGHAASAVDHDVAITAVGAHLIGVTIWIGGLGALVLVRRELGAGLVVSAQRYSTLAGACFVLVLVSGVTAGLVRVWSWDALFTSYGALLVAKLVAALGLGGIGWWHRRRSLLALAGEPGAPGPFLRLAGVELVIMGATVGLAVALSRTPPPARVQADPTLAAELLGYPMPGPLTAAGWITNWRIDPFWVPLALLAVAAYIVGVTRLRRRGDRWPVGRTVSWVGGWLVLVWATSAGPGVYGRVLFSVHMVQHMTLAMAVPILLALAAPVTLALRTLPVRRDGSRGAREWVLAAIHSRALAVLAHPVVAAGLFTSSLVVFYTTPLFDLAVRSHTGHVIMTAHFVASGYLFAWMICGPDPGPRRPPHLFRVIVLMAVMGFHAFFSVSIMGSTQIIGENWFTALGRTWGPGLQEDQRAGGAIAWALGDYPVALLTIALGIAWIRADRREAGRLDRKSDRDGDADLAAYNAHLQRLASTDGQRSP